MLAIFSTGMNYFSKINNNNTWSEPNSIQTQNTTLISRKEATASKNSIEDSTSGLIGNRQVSHFKMEENEKLQKLQKTVNRIRNFALAIGFIVTIYYAVNYHESKMSNEEPYAAKIIAKGLHPYEEKAEELFGREILELNRNDTRPKLLFLQSPNDETSAYSIGRTYGDRLKEKFKGDELEPHKKLAEYFGIWDKLENTKADNLRKLNINHDVKYSVVSDICKEIQSASQVGELKSVILSAHGSPTSMNYPFILNSHDGKLYSGIKRITKECFAGLAQNAEIILDSCSTGAKTDGFASTLAKISQRVVWAPSAKVINFPSFTSNSPPETYFIKDNIPFSTDLSCKFYPDGTSNCNYWQTKSWSAMAEHSMEGMTTLYNSCKYGIIFVKYLTGL